MGRCLTRAQFPRVAKIYSNPEINPLRGGGAEAPGFLLIVDERRGIGKLLQTLYFLWLEAVGRGRVVGRVQRAAAQLG